MYIERKHTIFDRATNFIKSKGLMRVKSLNITISKPILIVAILLIAAPLFAAENKDNEAAVEAFTKFVTQYMTLNRSKSIVSEDGRGQLRKYRVDINDDYGIDVKRTDSLMTPLLGVFEYTTKEYVSINPHHDRDAALSDNELRLQLESKHLHKYGYTNGKWKPISGTYKSKISGLDSNYSGVYDCNESCLLGIQP